MSTISPRLVRYAAASEPPEEYPLLSPPYSLGRSAERDIVLSDDLVSSLHAEIVYSNDRYYIIDRSRNGTWVNQQQIEPGQPVALSHQAWLGIGDDRKDFQYLNEQQTNDRPTQAIQSDTPAQSTLIMRGGRVFLRGTPLKLTLQELTLFNYLYEHMDKLINNEELVKQIYGEKAEDLNYGKEEIHRTINRLRGKLKDAAKKIIVNERGIGYRLCPPEE